MNITDILEKKVAHEAKGAVRYILGTPITVLESSFEVDNPYNGERIETALIYGMEENTKEEVLELLEYRSAWPLKGTFCQHSYDCCGCYYADSPDINKVGKVWFAEQRWSQNV